MDKLFLIMFKIVTLFSINVDLFQYSEILLNIFVEKLNTINKAGRDSYPADIKQGG